ncbi:hypothetical protein HELRODRAFT_163578 [Helobdella robusta]|uniref:UPAR/Ly6 domain-containing protein n=1 Tax=Helobdella robusta TaxID=6412 RepID=T1EU87_HELRO|nr:hypothetical protein HELRODRAFT_163578 [Helobdella robusta]ESN96509.1 hypothetical protein HELRODRAFT_163578 [Helobdella robusta]
MIIILLSALIVFVGPVRGLTCYNCMNYAGCTNTFECTTSFCTIYFAESLFSSGCTDTQKSNDCTMLESVQECTCNTPRCNTITPRPSTVTTTTAITSTSAGVTAAQTSPTTAISSKASAESLSTAYIILLVAVNAIILGSCGLIACCVYKNRERLGQLDSNCEDDKEN